MGRIGAILVLVALVVWTPGIVGAQEEPGEQLEAPALVLAGIPFDVVVRTGEGEPLELSRYELRSGEGDWEAVAGEDGTLVFAGVRLRNSPEIVLVRDGDPIARRIVRVMPGWLSIVPPLLAIAIALAFKQVIPALFLGVWLGATLLHGYGPVAALRGLLDSFNIYVKDALTNPDHAAIILFSLMIGGMVGIVMKNGGMQGVVAHIVKFATTPRKGQSTTALMGLVIFFDDYANTLVVGNTMRQVTDRLRISREKLAYLVDSTAAPVSCVALVTTWIGYEVGLIGTAIANIDGLDQSAYSIFLNQIPYSFYPLLTLFFVFNIAGTGRDFGSMHAAETRARSTGKVLGDGAQVDAAAGEGEELEMAEDTPARAINGVAPIVVLIGAVLAGLYVTGRGEALADSYTALMWGSLLGVVTAAGLTLVQRLLTTDELVKAWYAGVKSMMYAMIILVLAWALSGVSDGLHTAEYLVSVLSDTLIPATVPAIVFVLAGATAFATGSSWATMGILMPLVVPLVWAVLSAMPGDPAMHILYSTVACVLAGSVLGDHCSPISDTTILSSMASGCDHIEHVRTQMPYALTVGAVAVLAGTLPAGFGVPWWLCMIAGAAVLAVIVRTVGRPVEAPSMAPPVAGG